MIRSCLYGGWVSHRRQGAVANRFRYPLYVACLDLDELAALDAGLRLFALERGALFSIRGADYALGGGVSRPSTRPPPGAGLKQRVLERLADGGVDPLPDRVLLVTQPRVLGHVFNPVSFFVGLRGGEPSAVLAEINNTYDQSFAYLLDDRNRVATGRGAAFETDKRFFVSPFLADEGRYRWIFRRLDDELDIRVALRAAGRQRLDARLWGRRRRLSDTEILRSFLRIPGLPAQILLRIHWQALRLRARGLQTRRPTPDP